MRKVHLSVYKRLMLVAHVAQLAGISEDEFTKRYGGTDAVRDAYHTVKLNAARGKEFDHICYGKRRSGPIHELMRK